MPLQGCSGGLWVCRAGRAGAGGPGTLQEDGHRCVTTGELRRSGGGRTGRAGAGVLGMLQDNGHSCVTAGVLRRTAHVQGWPEDGAGGQGMFQDDGHNCVTTGVLRRSGGVQGRPSRGRGTRNVPGRSSQLCHYRAAQEDWGCAGSAGQGAEGPGMLQEDGLSYIFVWLHVSL